MPNFGDKLFLEYAFPMREAVRRYEAKRVLAQRKPLTGIYWWVPVPSGSGVEWVITAFHDDVYGEPMHDTMWKHVLDFLKSKWPKMSVTPDLEMAYAGLPRGRISQDASGGYAHYHGNDAPGDLGAARSQFNLTLGGRNKELFDVHEQMLPDDAAVVRRVIGY